MLNKWINSIDDVIATITLIALIILTSTNVFFRFVLKSPIGWGEEVSLALHVWIVFIGISSTMKREGHVGIDYFVEKLPSKLKVVTKAIREIVIYGVLLYVLVYLGITFTVQSSTVTPVLGISAKWIALAVPVGGLFTAYHFTKILVKSYHNQDLKKGDA